MPGWSSKQESCFNGGPDNCPAKPDQTWLTACGSTPLQWRAGQLSGQTCRTPSHTRPCKSRLQWRAGQLSGQTKPCSTEARTSSVLQWRAGQLSGQTFLLCRTPWPVLAASMEGRTIVRPNLRPAAAGTEGEVASMEGRTIVRPNRAAAAQTRTLLLRFNGGPDNCPAKLRSRRRRLRSASGFNGGPDNCPAKRHALDGRQDGTNELQWRAGQLSGQTGCVLSRPHRRTPGFNGGPDNCPAKPVWQTPPACRPVGFNGGPDNCPAKRERQRSVQALDVLASMEGRTIVRPNHRRHLPVQRRRRRFNGGPDNCPAKLPSVQVTVPARVGASMEGRTIVRPNFPACR